MPWLFATIMTKYRVSRYKWLEPILLFFTALLLVMTYSRGGILITVAVASLMFLLIGHETFSQVWRWFAAAFHRTDLTIGVKVRSWGIRLGSLLLIISVLVGAVSLLSEKIYFSRLWNTSAENLEEYIIENYVGSRVAYAWGAIQEFQDHPWTGVGLGASGFYIYQNLPDWALTTVPEIARQLSPTTYLYPNPKNLYVRLLAETGLLGFVLFVAFQLFILGNILTALQMQAGVNRFLGIAGLFAWLAILLYCFTQDSFAFPNLWINLGIISSLVNCVGSHPAKLISLQSSREIV